MILTVRELEEGGLRMASITMHCGDTLRVPAGGLIEALADAGVIASSRAEAIRLTDAEIQELRDRREQGYRYIARYLGIDVFAFVECPHNDAGCWYTAGDYTRLGEPYTGLPDLDKTALSITALLQTAAAER